MWIFMTDARLVEDFFTEKVATVAIGQELAVFKGHKALSETWSNSYYTEA